MDLPSNNLSEYTDTANHSAVNGHPTELVQTNDRPAPQPPTYSSGGLDSWLAQTGVDGGVNLPENLTADEQKVMKAVTSEYKLSPEDANRWIMLERVRGCEIKASSADRASGVGSLQRKIELVAEEAADDLHDVGAHEQDFRSRVPFTSANEALKEQEEQLDTAIQNLGDTRSSIDEFLNQPENRTASQQPTNVREFGAFDVFELWDKK